MNNRTPRGRSINTSSRLSRAVLALALACGLFAGNTHTAHAQTEVVIDPAAIAQAVKEDVKETEQWLEIHAQYALQDNQFVQQAIFWQQQLNKLQQLNFTLFTMQNQFQKIDPEYGVQDACPGVQGGLAGDITSALQSFVPNMGGDVVKQQQQLCQMIVVTKNRKYNDTVDYLQAVGASADVLLKLETRLMQNSPNPGDMQSNQTEGTTFQARATQAEKDWQANMTQDNAQIDMLMQMQSILSRRAMGGSPTVMGSVVNAAVLAGALQ